MERTDRTVQGSQEALPQGQDLPCSACLPVSSAQSKFTMLDNVQQLQGESCEAAARSEASCLESSKAVQCRPHYVLPMLLQSAKHRMMGRMPAVI